MIEQPISRGLAVFAECLAVGLAWGDQHRLTGSSNGNGNISNAPPTVDRRRITSSMNVCLYELSKKQRIKMS